LHGASPLIDLSFIVTRDLKAGFVPISHIEQVADFPVVFVGVWSNQPYLIELIAIFYAAPQDFAAGESSDAWLSTEDPY
jgi:hypothetical protein